MMGRHKVPGIFAILFVGGLVAIGLARAFPHHTDAVIRTMAVLSVGAAILYWADLPIRRG